MALAYYNLFISKSILTIIKTSLNRDLKFSAILSKLLDSFLSASYLKIESSFSCSLKSFCHCSNLYIISFGAFFFNFEVDKS
nr:MAG TPA: hypothetical protein [Caudoviricetes sp.]